MARQRSFEPRRLDVAAFAEAGAALEGRIAQSALPRLAESVLAPADAAPPPVQWQAQGEQRRVGGAPQVWLHLHAATEVALQCQRCLQPMTVPLALDRDFRFAESEDEAARLDEESEEDVLAASHSFDVQSLVEDELILALPLVPRHEVCPQPLPVGTDPADAGDETAANPFAVLARLRRPA